MGGFNHTHKRIINFNNNNNNNNNNNYQISMNLVLFCLVLAGTIFSSMESKIQCTQIVPYNPPDIIKPFHEKTRRFDLCGREWTLSQDWEHSGVAGVVWEAVSTVLSVAIAFSPDCPPY